MAIVDMVLTWPRHSRPRHGLVYNCRLVQSTVGNTWVKLKVNVDHFMQVKIKS